jgi:hypothetical protein
VEIDASPTDLQLEFANFQSDLMLKENFCDSSLADFCSKYVSSLTNVTRDWFGYRECVNLFAEIS